MSKLSLKKDYVRNMDFSPYLYDASNLDSRINDSITSIIESTDQTKTAEYCKNRIAYLELNIKDNL